MTNSNGLPMVDISSRAAQRIFEGYLWIFSNEVHSKDILSKGELCSFGHQGKFIGMGYANPHSLIYGRVLSTEPVSNVSLLLEKLLEAAFEVRRPLLITGSVRLVFSESDFFPGLILDWYGGVAVLQSSTAGMDGLIPTLIELIPNVFNRVFGIALTALVVRCDAGVRSLEGIENKSYIAFGDELVVKQGTLIEDGVSYAADFLQGQKTGFFLDQRENRQYWGKALKKSNAKKVLDLCSYSGGWGLRALKSGVLKVTFVDQSDEALNLIRRGMKLNGFSSEKAEFVKSDVFDFLEQNKETYDAIVSDPPAFVKSKKVLPQAKKAYEKLNRLAWKRLATGGILFSCSCSYHLAEEEFFELLWSGFMKEEGKALIFYRGGQAEDHPIYLSMPETRYLKCLGIRKSSAIPSLQKIPKTIDQ